MSAQQQSPLFSQPQETTYNREEEYSSAKRAAVEATLVGRETLEAATRQGEQLQNAENLADETEYKLDRATRVLREMTWAGWWANKFSQDVQPPEYSTTTVASSFLPPTVYDNVPPLCSAAAQAVQNYHANLQVMETCETNEQKETCKVICDNMFQTAKREITKLHRRQQESTEDDLQGFSSRLGKDLKMLRERQDLAEEGTIPTSSSTSSPGTRTTGKGASKSALFEGKSSEGAVVAPSPTGIDEVQIQQESHLDFMSKHLEELGSLATNLSSSLAFQTDTLESLDGKSESMLYKSKMVTRRADRMIQKKSWTKAKAEFLYNACIRHISTGKYIAVSSANSSLVLSSKFNETCIFGVWQRQTSAKVFGLQSKYSNRWVGQNLLGNLVCSAYSFDRREEWDADEADWAHTTLLCASAGWGNGGYLMVKEDHTLTIGGGGLQDKKSADSWCIQEYGATKAATNASSSSSPPNRN
jgi:hypothetical protein